MMEPEAALASVQALRALAIQIVCPTCNAAKDKACTAPGAMFLDVHLDRVRAARHRPETMTKLVIGDSAIAVFTRVMAIVNECDKAARGNAAHADMIEGPALTASLAECWKARAAECRNIREKLLAAFDVQVAEP